MSKELARVVLLSMSGSAAFILLATFYPRVLCAIIVTALVLFILYLIKKAI